MKHLGKVAWGLIVYSPAIIVYSLMVRGFINQGQLFEIWMLLLVPFFFVLHMFLTTIIMQLVVVTSYVYKSFRHEKNVFPLIYCLIAIVGPVLYFTLALIDN